MALPSRSSVVSLFLPVDFSPSLSSLVMESELDYSGASFSQLLADPVGPSAAVALPRRAEVEEDPTNGEWKRGGKEAALSLGQSQPAIPMIEQGTYSSVFIASKVDTGRIVALKKGYHLVQTSNSLTSGYAQSLKLFPIHRDIKCANLLVNNEGIQEIAYFSLASIWSPGTNQSLSARVMTLWYRAPELLLGSINYEPSVDLWSIGCVVVELFLGKPLLQGRTECSTNGQRMNRSGIKQEIPAVNGGTKLLADLQPNSNNASQDENRQIKQTSRKLPFSGLVLNLTALHGQRRQKDVQDQERKIELSGPLLQAQKVDEFLDSYEQHIQKAIQKSWFQRGQKSGQ
ncbi:hypothetical protein ZIOFF_031458 [Zingiber officinale]|uniref:[RNA-polymerase]-subunit kinase n=1 Tax=Zingiber officinale TaxID=94328 RepID=A0A8J5GDC3_ZINOF|nr:hypothetical protein ZIOFF_031458 [Zingiber officinale]